MGTRSVIAIPSESGGWQGRYCHWDGYRTGVGTALWHIVKRDGLETAVRTLVFDNHSWSSINGSQVKDDNKFRESLKWVSGYGYAHTDGELNEWIHHDGDKWGTEYAYVLSPEGMTSYAVDFDDNVTLLGFNKWGSTPDFVLKAEEMFGVFA